MGRALGEIRAEVAEFAASFDPSLIAPSDAESVVREAAAIENMAATIKSLAARRAAEGGGWRREGAKSPAHDLARKTGSTVNKAKEALETADKLAELPALDAAARRGELSPSQTAPIADAASKDPSSEERLVAKAKRASVGELREECERTKAAAEPDDDARHQAIHRSRSLRSFTCADGAGEIRYRSTRDEVAEILSIIRGYANREFDLARLEGRHEPGEAYLADGLLAACRAAAGGSTATDDGADEEAATKPAGRVRKTTPTKIVVRIDWDALLRGWPVDGEVCEIAGLGSVPVSVVRAMMASGRRVPRRGRHQGRRRPQRLPPRAQADRVPRQRPRLVSTRVHHRRVQQLRSTRDRPPQRLGEDEGHPLALARAPLRPLPRQQDPPRLGPRRRHRQATDGPARRPPPPPKPPTAARGHRMKPLRLPSVSRAMPRRS